MGYLAYKGESAKYCIDSHNDTKLSQSATNHIILLKALVEQCVSPDLDIAGADYGQPEFGMLDSDGCGCCAMQRILWE